MGRLAWVADSGAAILLNRLPLLMAAVQRRHKVLALAPDFTPSDRLTLLAHGIESAALPVPGAGLSLFAALAARRRLMLTLHEWRATAVIAEGPSLLVQVLRAAAQAGVSTLVPVLPSVEARAVADREQQMARKWVMRSATAAFASTTDAARQFASKAGPGRGVPVSVLPDVALDLGVLTQVPLPGLETGLIVLAVTDAAGLMALPFEAAVAALGTSMGRARFQVTGEFATLPNQSRDLSSIRVERITVDRDDRAALAAAMAAAHVVVIAGTNAWAAHAFARAAALGRPIVALDTARNRDLIDAGVNGWLVPPGDAAELVAALAGTISAVLKRPDLLPGMARAARLKAERRLDVTLAEFTVFQALGLADLRVQAA